MSLLGPDSLPHPLPSTAMGYLDDVFGARAARSGGIIRRRVRDVERIAGRADFLDYCCARSWRVVENNGHFVVFCNSAPLRRLA